MANNSCNGKNLSAAAEVSCVAPVSTMHTNDKQTHSSALFSFYSISIWHSVDEETRGNLCGAQHICVQVANFKYFHEFEYIYRLFFITICSIFKWEILSSYVLRYESMSIPSHALSRFNGRCSPKLPFRRHSLRCRHWMMSFLSLVAVCECVRLWGCV